MKIKKNGFVQAVKNKIMRIRVCLIFVLFSACSNGDNSLMNKSKIKKYHQYRADVKELEEVMRTYMSSSTDSKKTQNRSEILDIKIDTLLYGPQDKIAFLIVAKRHNSYIYGNDKSEFIGKGFIGLKNNSIFKILDELKYSVTGNNSYYLASKNLREIYFNELDYVEEYKSMDDEDFWNSSFWQQ